MIRKQQREAIGKWEKKSEKRKQEKGSCRCCFQVNLSIGSGGALVRA